MSIIQERNDVGYAYWVLDHPDSSVDLNVPSPVFDVDISAPGGAQSSTAQTAESIK